MREPADRIDLLSAAEDPFANLRTVLAWSYESLGDAEASAFRRLAPHPGGDVTLPEAAALVGQPVPEMRSQLDRLASVHLVERSRSRAYRVHDLLRGYAAERLAADEPAGAAGAAVGRLLGWYLHVAYRAREALAVGAPLPELAPAGEPSAPVPDFPDSAAALGWYEEARRSLSAGVRLGVTHGHPGAAWRLGRLLHDFFAVRHHYDDWVEVGRSALCGAVREDQPTALYHACLLLGSGQSYLADPAPAGPTVREALRHAGKLGDHAKISTALSLLSVVTMRLGDGGRALELQQRSVAAARHAGRPFALAHALLNLGARQVDAGHPRPAVATNREALELYRSLGAGHHQAMVLGNLAEAHEKLGDLTGALACAEEALTVDARYGNGPTPNNLVTLGRIRAALDRPDGARAAWRRALSLMRPEGDHRIPEVEALLVAVGPGWERAEIPRS
jgi:tetratricopeptide (TPR) repeat protein